MYCAVQHIASGVGEKFAGTTVDPANSLRIPILVGGGGVTILVALHNN
jgi:hypothetical protein